MAKPQITPEQQQWLAQLQAGGNLTPEQIATLSKDLGGAYGSFSQNGFDYNPIVQYGEGQDHAGERNIQGYMANPTGTPVKGAYEAYGYYDPQGKYQGGRQGVGNDYTDLATALAMVAGGYFGGSALANAAGGAGAAGGAAGSAGGTFGGSASGLGSGLGDLGLGSITDAGISGSALTSTGMTSAGLPGIGGVTGTIGSTGLGLGAPSGLWGAEALGAGGAAGLGGAAAGAGGAGAGTAATTAAKTAAESGMGSLLGPAATALGAIAGSQGNKQEQSATRDIPEWLKPYAQKVLGMGSSLLDQQMTPQAQQGWQTMQARGQGLLNTPQMGNGFNRFFPGK